MQPLRRQTLIEQTASHLRAGISSGRWRDRLPGVGRLAEELDVSKDTVRGALRLLEAGGDLQPQGAGKSRQIPAIGSALAQRRSLRIALLASEPLAEASARTQQTLLRLVSAIEHAGHECFIADRALSQLGTRPEKLARLVATTPADAWVAYTASYEVLSWFVQRNLPVLALGGQPQALPIARSRTDISAAMNAAVDALVAQHHRRIVLISPLHWREPALHPAAHTFRERMSQHHLPCSDYHLPDWAETPAGLQQLLQTLFRATPPTALLTLKSPCAVAILGFLSQHGLRVPEDVSLVSMAPDPVFGLRVPEIAHFNWSIDPHIRRITRWVRNLALGRPDFAAKVIEAEFVAGGTIGPMRPPRT